MYLPKVIKLMDIRQSSGIIFHSFSLKTVNFSTFVFNKVVRVRCGGKWIYNI